MVLRRIADAIDRRSTGERRRRSILYIAATDFLSELQPHHGNKGGTGYSGWDLSTLSEPVFWSALLLSQRRQRFAMTLLGQVHRDTAAIKPYVQEKHASQDILNATPGIDAESLIGFMDLAVQRFQPPGTAGVPLVLPATAIELLKAVLLRGAMVGELRSSAVREAWLRSHPQTMPDTERHWKIAQGRAETLYRSWLKKRRRLGRRLV